MIDAWLLFGLIMPFVVFLVEDIWKLMIQVLAIAFQGTQFHKRFCAPMPNFCALRQTFEKLFTGAKLWRKVQKKGVGCKSVFEIDPNRGRQPGLLLSPVFKNSVLLGLFSRFWVTFISFSTHFWGLCPPPPPPKKKHQRIAPPP